MSTNQEPGALGVQVIHSQTQKHQFHSVIGAVDTMRELASEFGRTFLKGQNAAAALFSPG